MGRKESNQTKTVKSVRCTVILFIFFVRFRCFLLYSKTCVKRPLSKRLKIVSQDQLPLNAGQKYCRMLTLLQGEHSAILSIFIKLPFFIKILVLSILSGGFTQVLYRFYCIHT